MAHSIISARPGAVNPHTSLTFGEFCVLGDALSDLAGHFEAADGMTERKAWALAHKALRIDPAQWRAAGAAHRRAQPLRIWRGSSGRLRRLLQRTLHPSPQSLAFTSAYMQKDEGAKHRCLTPCFTYGGP